MGFAHRKSTGLPPSEHDVSLWFSHKPESYFEGKENEANRWFLGAARALLHDEIENEKNVAVKLALERLGRFWPSFWLGNLVGVTSNVIFAGLIIFFVLFANTDFSFVAWSRRVFGAH